MDIEAEIAAIRSLDVERLAAAIRSIGFECTRCGACCRGLGDEHTATLSPDDVAAIMRATGSEWGDVARPTPFGVTHDDGETFEWAIQTDDCGDCRFLDTGSGSGSETATCRIYDHRPWICRTYPFSLRPKSSEIEPDGVERSGPVLAHACEGIGRDISIDAAREMARDLKERTIRELEEAVAVLDHYEPVAADGVIVHDSEGAKRADGTPLE